MGVGIILLEVRKWPRRSGTWEWHSARRSIASGTNGTPGEAAWSSPQMSTTSSWVVSGSARRKTRRGTNGNLAAAASSRHRIPTPAWTSSLLVADSSRTAPPEAGWRNQGMVGRPDTTSPPRGERHSFDSESRSTDEARRSSHFSHGNWPPRPWSVSPVDTDDPWPCEVGRLRIPLQRTRPHQREPLIACFAACSARLHPDQEGVRRGDSPHAIPNHSEGQIRAQRLLGGSGDHQGRNPEQAVILELLPSLLLSLTGSPKGQAQELYREGPEWGWIRFSQWCLMRRWSMSTGHASGSRCRVRGLQRSDPASTYPSSGVAPGGSRARSQPERGAQARPGRPRRPAASTCWPHPTGQAPPGADAWPPGAQRHPRTGARPTGLWDRRQDRRNVPAATIDTGWVGPPSGFRGCLSLGQPQDSLCKHPYGHDVPRGQYAQ